MLQSVDHRHPASVSSALRRCSRARRRQRRHRLRRGDRAGDRRHSLASRSASLSDSLAICACAVLLAASTLAFSAASFFGQAARWSAASPDLSPTRATSTCLAVYSPPPTNEPNAAPSVAASATEAANKALRFWRGLRLKQRSGDDVCGGSPVQARAPLSLPRRPAVVLQAARACLGHRLGDCRRDRRRFDRRQSAQRGLRSDLASDLASDFASVVALNWAARVRLIGHGPVLALVVHQSVTMFGYQLVTNARPEA